MKKILVIGSKGFFGKKLVKKFSATECIKHLESVKEIEEEIKKSGAEIVINFAGKTGKPNVDWCESHKFETFHGNLELPLKIAEACKNTNAKMIHLGSGCVYSGTNNGRDFSEDDEPNFYGSFYSRTKAMSEEIIKEKFPGVLQLRIRMPVDSEPSPKNLITKLSKYNKIINVENSVTFVDDLIYATGKLIEKNETGIFNIVNSPALTHKQIVDKYNKIVDPNFRPEFISLEELEKFTVAKRSNCVLTNKKLESKGIKLRNSIVALEEDLKKYKKSL